MADEIQIEVVRADSARQVILPLKVPVNCSIGGALKLSGLFPEGIEHLHVGIFGKLRHLDFVVDAGDRIEVYRKLHIDPKVARAQKVEIERRAKRLNRRKDKAIVEQNS